VPDGVKPVGPYSPGLAAGGFLYVSGQGARDAKGQMPATPEAQIRQTLENVKAVVSAGKLTMEHVVYAQVYLADMKHYDLLNKIWSQYFPKNPPARSTIAVTKMPTDTPFEVAAVAVRNLKTKKVIAYPGRTMPVPVSPAVQTGNRVYLAGGLGRDFTTGKIPEAPREQVKVIMDGANTILKGAGLELRHLTYVNVYVSPEMPMKALAEAIEQYIPSETAKTIVQTAALPFGVRLQISGVASRELKRLGNCTGIKDTVYCSARAGTIRQALESLKQDLQANGLSMEKVVSSNVYLDDIADFAAMNKIYAEYFGKVPPTRTTVQPWKRVSELSLPPATGVPEDGSPRAQVSVVAIR
jgi:reactive intermediate/imine deaminase